MDFMKLAQFLLLCISPGILVGLLIAAAAFYATFPWKEHPYCPQCGATMEEFGEGYLACLECECDD